ncbi:hypothetical protein KGA66_19245 [Actinocrinis puniceicyclus]|uniref:Uncharacterized protein n=1 Tax=Actinocrinis puniceicyclus TaxID=977794 RepID=A0A8J7WU46_9ACTN|nr:hypothetical protein [Actinocrinis puniceicyclus]MBS2965194.1 hypothetical protein [Actinocrinis puniceicyclus]
MSRWPREAAEPDPSSFGSRPYDLVKEFVVALVGVTVLTLLLAAVFSSPDEKSMSVASWAKADPGDFTATALAELDGSSDTAGYGPPYNTAADGQKIGPFALAKTVGVTHAIDTAQAFVLTPLEQATQSPDVRAALGTYMSASDDQRGAWTDAYSTALDKAGDDPAKVTPGGYGPVPVLLSQLLAQAKSGSLDATLSAESGFYHSDYTLPLMFLADGSDLAAAGEQQHLAGDQWGMTNEVDNYPGQVWLIPDSFFYQVSPFDHSPNGDALVWAVMAVLTAVFLLVPFIPGLRRIPRLIPVYRLVWREHYKTHP